MVVVAALSTIVAGSSPATGSSPPRTAFHGSSPSVARTIGIASSPGGGGYFTLDAVGGIFTHGDARYFGSVPGLRQQGNAIGPAAIVDLSTTPDGNGYWVLDSVGGMFAFGNAQFLGSIPGRRNAGVPIGDARVLDLEPVGSAGYYLLDHVGGVHTFGSAPFFGSLPQRRQQGVPVGPAPAISIAATPQGDGYFMLDQVGGVHTFGSAQFFGSLPGRGITMRAIGFELTPGGSGYWILDERGGVHAFGSAQFHGAPQDILGNPVGIATNPALGDGYWVAYDTGQVVALPSGDTERPGSQAFRGTGNQVVGPFTLGAGLTIFKGTHQGTSNFVVWLIDGAGNKRELVVNKIGAVTEFDAASVAAGPYTLEVKADWQWTVNVDQPRPATGQALPLARSGRGSRVIGPFQGGADRRATRVTYSHDGSSNFVIWLLDEKGEGVDLLVNHIGPTSGTVLGDFRGLRYLEIKADGNWSVSTG